jgi:hypothetical protein
MPVCRSSSAAIPDQASGSDPLRMFLNRRHTLSLVRALQEGGRVPAGAREVVGVSSGLMGAHGHWPRQHHKEQCDRTCVECTWCSESPTSTPMTRCGSSQTHHLGASQGTNKPAPGVCTPHATHP